MSNKEVTDKTVLAVNAVVMVCIVCYVCAYYFVTLGLEAPWPEASEACFYGEEGRERPAVLKIMLVVPIVVGLVTSFVFDLLMIKFLDKKAMTLTKGISIVYHLY